VGHLFLNNVAEPAFGIACLSIAVGSGLYQAGKLLEERACGGKGAAPIQSWDMWRQAIPWLTAAHLLSSIYPALLILSIMMAVSLYPLGFSISMFLAGLVASLPCTLVVTAFLWARKGSDCCWRPVLEMGLLNAVVIVLTIGIVVGSPWVPPAPLHVASMKMDFAIRMMRVEGMWLPCASLLLVVSGVLNLRRILVPS
jgi:hypothetical protein